MNSINSAAVANSPVNSRWVSLFLSMLEKIEYGTVTITTPDGEYLNFRGQKEGVHASLHIYDWKLCENLFLKGDIGLGESYIDGLWESENISNLIRFGIENKNSLAKVIKGSFVKIIFYRLKHLLNRNSVEGSRKNIHAHYDLGNSFYKLWLDKSMTYSSALFKGQSEKLVDAQENKYQNILTQLNAKAGDHILEVGCGWGGFMEYAARQGVKVTGITISNEQFEYAKERVSALSDLATVKLMDYRNINEKYDHIVSIEMFEALGVEYWKSYFKILHSALKPEGKIIIQSITIADQDFKDYKNGSDFIQQYIFPGGMLPSVDVFKKSSSSVGLKVYDSLEFGLDYAETLKRWEESFTHVLDQVKGLGFDEKFVRTWRFYLKYCQGGFEAKKISVYQFYLTK